MAYAKAILAVIAAGVVALQQALDDDVLLANEWTSIGIAVLTAIGVYLIPNKPPA